MGLQQARDSFATLSGARWLLWLSRTEQGFTWAEKEIGA